MRESLFQSTLPIREETYSPVPLSMRYSISIHSSHTGRDPDGSQTRFLPFQFQSTLPIREETFVIRAHWFRFLNFNPLFPYGKRHERTQVFAGAADFNPLFPYGKRLALRVPASSTVILFQSTLPIREETSAVSALFTSQIISIHSSHTGRDSKRIQPFCTKSCCICTT